MVGLAYFAAVLSMIGDWFRVISKKTKEEVHADIKWNVKFPSGVQEKTQFLWEIFLREEKHIRGQELP